MRNISEWLVSNGITGVEFVEAERRWRRSTENSWHRPPGWPEGGPAPGFLGADHPGHLLVTAARLRGAAVYDVAGVRVGQVFDVSIEKASGRVIHVLVATGGVLGVGRRFQPLPWEAFSYLQDRRGYSLPFTQAELRARPRLRRDELEWCGAGTRSPFDDAYCHAYFDLPAA
jgi:sporulation protein YlmC with PRC-barrel domain